MKSIRYFFRRGTQSTALRSIRPAVFEMLESRRLLALDVSLVADINTAPAGSLLSSFVGNEEVAYFAATHGAHAGELWRTDGTREGTFAAPLPPEHYDYAATFPMAMLGDVLVFSSTVNSRRDLWRTDGTLTGIVRLVEGFRSPHGRVSAVLGEEIYFYQYQPSGSIALVASRGTPGDLRIVAGQDVLPIELGYFELVTIADAVYFRAYTDANGAELWRTDGTTAGTTRLTDINPGPASAHPEDFIAASDGLYFTAIDGTGRRGLYKTWSADGATERIAEFTPISDYTDRGYRAAAGRDLYFVADDGEHGKELWRTDGTSAGLTRLTDFPDEFRDSWPDQVTAAASGLVFFTADVSGASRELWVTDGTVGGTRMVTDLYTGESNGSWPRGLTAYQEGIVFSAQTPLGQQLWTSDGTESGTRLFASAPRVNLNWVNSPIFALRDALVFSGHDDEAGTEIWRSDGTDQGTYRLADIQPGTVRGVWSDIVAAHDNTVYFMAEDSTWQRGIWHSRGERDATAPIDYPERALQTSNPAWWIDFNGGMMVARRDGLFRVDGATHEMELVRDLPVWRDYDYPHAPPAIVGDQLYFVTHHSWETPIWSTDGTSAGTVAIPDANGELAWSHPAGLTAFQGKLYFVTQYNGSNLWTTDGTAEGTRKLTSFLYEDFANLHSPVVAGDTLFFANQCGIGGSGDARGALWTSDGTPEGTRPIAPFYCIWEAVAVGDTLIFSADDFEQRTGLWRSDGTVDGTYRISAIREDGKSVRPRALTVIGGLVYFVVDDGVHGAELWRSDGTAAGTRLVSDIVPGSDSSSPMELVNVNGTLFFTAEEPDRGRELWRSDGTPAGTWRVADIWPGVPSSSPEDLVSAHGVLYFSADDGFHGRELWKLEAPSGDANYDGVVSPNDLDLVKSQFGARGDKVAGDVTADGKVDINDLNAVRNNLNAEIAASPASSDVRKLRMHERSSHPDPNAVDVLFTLNRILISGEHHLRASPRKRAKVR